MKKGKNIYIKRIIKTLTPYIKMDKKIINFDDTEIEENEFRKD